MYDFISESLSSLYLSAFQLAYSYIQCTDARWPTLYYNAYAGYKDQHLTPR